MKNIDIKHVLIVRFRQMGDAIVSTNIWNTLRENFPEAEIDIILNENIAPLFEGHPSIDHIITFNNEEQKQMWQYIPKVRKIMHQTHYDVIIDMRSTIKTLPFTLFSLSTPFRIGVWKKYNKWIQNYRIKENPEYDIIKTDLSLLKPLEKLKHIVYINKFSLHISDEEKRQFKEYMLNSGIDLEKPIMLVGVTAKLEYKTWDEEKMVAILKRVLKEYPHLQMIFNYAPGQEKTNAFRVYEKLDKDPRIHIDIAANSSRELVAMAENITFYFGNEGGARHIVHAMGKPSFVICAPTTNKQMWIPKNDIPAQGISPSDFVPMAEQKNMSLKERYDLIPIEKVWEGLKTSLDATLKATIPDQVNQA